MPYSAAAIVNAFFDLATADGVKFTPMKAQKLVFFAHGWYLARNDGQPLIYDRIEAWKFGPVIRSLYRDLASYGDQPITRRIRTIEFMEAAEGFGWFESEPNIPPDDPAGQRTRELLRDVWATYGRHSAGQLSEVTHLPGSPWDQVRQQNGGRLPDRAIIPDPMIQRFYQEQFGSRPQLHVGRA